MYHTISFRSMNTDVSAWLWSTHQATALLALREVECTFREAHTRFTRFEATSELSALNAAAGQPFAASPDLFEVVERALRFSDMTSGLFNPAILGALEAAGYDRTFDAVKRDGDCCPQAPSAPVMRPRVQMGADRRTITLPAGTRLDLGGIVKGWTVQRAAQQLSDCGSCLIDAGGDMMTFGTPPSESGWRIGVADPFDARRDLITLRLRDTAVATSGTDRRRWIRNSVIQHHLIDPRTGRPSESDLISVTVIAPTAVEAEVCAKTVFLMGSYEGMQFVERRPLLAALLVTRDGDVIPSSRLENYLDVHFVYNSSEILAA